MRGLKAKAVRKAIGKLFDQDQAKFPMGYKMKGRTIYNVRRIMYQRIKRLTNTEKMSIGQIGGLFA